MGAGIVLTGGTSKMEGVVELAEEIFHMPVSIGKPKGITGLTDIVKNPIYSTAVGLLQYAADRQAITVSGGQSDIDSFVKRIKGWFLG